MFTGLLLLSLAVLENSDASQFEPQRRCVPSATVRGPCHVCVCTVEGVFHCRSQECQEDKYANVAHHDLPQIKQGEKCVYGKSYKMDCNICRCGHNNSLLCTKMGCLPYWPKRTRRQLHGQRDDLTNNKKIDWLSNIKRLPKGSCTPGKIYKRGCKLCFCTDKEIGICSKKKLACGRPKPMYRMTPDDVSPAVSDDEFAALPALAHGAAKCEPGKAYKVDCNPCLCKHNLNLMCDQMLCVSHEDMHRIAAEKQAGKPCKGTELTESDCVRCACVDRKLRCEPLEDCVTEYEMELELQAKTGPHSRIALNYTKDKCIPNFVYKIDCNKCYCQKNRSLRCTLKTCLTYAEVKELEKIYEYLEKNGL